MEAELEKYWKEMPAKLRGAMEKSMKKSGRDVSFWDPNDPWGHCNEVDCHHRCEKMPAFEIVEKKDGKSIGRLLCHCSRCRSDFKSELAEGKPLTCEVNWGPC